MAFRAGQISKKCETHNGFTAFSENRCFVFRQHFRCAATPKIIKKGANISKIAPKVIKKTHARTNVDNISKKAAEWLPKWTKRGPKGSRRAPKATKREPTGANKEPKMTKREPKGAKREPKGPKRRPRGAKREPKVSQRATKMHQKVDLRKRSRKSADPWSGVSDHLVGGGFLPPTPLRPGHPPRAPRTVWLKAYKSSCSVA